MLTEDFCMVKDQS